MELVNILKEDIKNKKGKYIARSYYDHKSNTEEGEISTISNGNISTVKINNKTHLYTNYFSLIVNQKIDYLLSKNPEMDTKKNIVNLSNSSLTSMLEDMSLNASLDTASWLHFYVNKDNKLDWILVPDKEIIPIYDSYKKEIGIIIRYKLIDKDTYKVETWTEKGLKVEYIENDKINPEKTEIKSHYVDVTIYGGKVENKEAKNLPFIPFIPLFNNKAKKSDLNNIKEQIDMYNAINSGLIDNINLFQEAIVKLTGFAGDSEELQEIRDNMIKYKMVGIPSGGGDKSDIDYMGIEIPTEARELLLRLLKENIFKISQSLDPDKETHEGNITNVVVKTKYSSLDQKANGFEKQLKLFYEKFVEYINKFYAFGFDNEITFNRSQIFNESEEIDNCLKSMGVTSITTLLKNHPWVTNVDEELELIAVENEKKQIEQDKSMEKQLKLENNMSSEDIK